MLRLDQRTAVVTGGGSGIGAAISRLFARQGARVAIFEVNSAAGESVAADIRAAKGEVKVFPADVADESGVQRAMAAAATAFGSVDILVNNAGIAHVGSVLSTTAADFDRLFAVNVKGVFLCTQAAIPHMLRAGKGAILNVASIASLIGLDDRFAYGMTKGAVLTMTYSIAVDFMKKGIRCNCVCPARIHTPFVDGFLAKNYPGREAEMFDKLAAYQPIGRMGTPEEVAHLALYLCSDEAAFITGQAFPIDGGVLCQ